VIVGTLRAVAEVSRICTSCGRMGTQVLGLTILASLLLRADQVIE
jgi:hypothetical protein